MEFRIHGKSPFKILAVHGGPGAIGDLKDLCEMISDDFGVVESFHNGSTIYAQIEEVKKAVLEQCSFPVIAIGHSWCAWLVLLAAAKYPELFKKIILIGSSPFLDEYIPELERRRLSRLTDAEKNIWEESFRNIAVGAAELKKDGVRRITKLFLKTEYYDPIPEIPVIDADLSHFTELMKEKNDLRKSGKILEIISKIKCPVALFHGDYDPHPFEGVRKPLEEVMGNFKFYLLEKCGHVPWREKQAIEIFMKHLSDQIRNID